MVAQGTALTRPSTYSVTARPERAALVCSGLDGSPRGACWEVVSLLSCWGQSGRHLELHCLGSSRSEERRVGKECRSRWSPYH